MAKKDKSFSEEVNELKASYKDKKQSESNELLQFFIGMILLAVGLFMLSKRVMVHSSWYTWRIGGIDFSSGTVVIPLIIGIIWYFCNPRSIASKIIITLGIIFIVVSIIMSVRINLIRTSLFEYILILGMSAAGAGLLLKTLVKKRD